MSQVEVDVSTFEWFDKRGRRSHFARSKCIDLIGPTQGTFHAFHGWHLMTYRAPAAASLHFLGSG